MVKCSEGLPKAWEKVKLLFLLEFPTTYIAEQGFSQVLHMRNKQGNRLDMNKTWGSSWHQQDLGHKT